jgi:PadR family transcriptional regulator PadR
MNRYYALRCSQVVRPIARLVVQNWVTQLRKGLVELCVMRLLDTREAYGYQILQQLNEAAGLELTESTLYPVLARLARDGLVKTRETPSPNGPPRRYYRLTAGGKSRLAELTSQWVGIRDAVDHLLNGESHESGNPQSAG